MSDELAVIFMDNFLAALRAELAENGLEAEADEWEINKFHEGFLVSSPVHGVNFYVEAGEDGEVFDHDVQQVAMFISGAC